MTALVNRLSTATGAGNTYPKPSCPCSALVASGSPSPIQATPMITPWPKPSLPPSKRKKPTAGIIPRRQTSEKVWMNTSASITRSGPIKHWPTSPRPGLKNFTGRKKRRTYEKSYVQKTDFNKYFLFDFCVFPDRPSLRFN